MAVMPLKAVPSVHQQDKKRKDYPTIETMPPDGLYGKKFLKTLYQAQTAKTPREDSLTFSLCLSLLTNIALSFAFLASIIVLESEKILLFPFALILLFSLKRLLCLWLRKN